MTVLFRQIAVACALSPALISSHAGADAIDDLRNRVESALRAEHVGGSYAAIINFESEPDVSSSTLYVDSGLSEEEEISLTKFPLRHEFDITGRGWKPFVQATLARLTLEQNVDFTSGGSERLENKWTSYSATIGGGVRIPLGGGFSIMPAVDGGYASLKNDATYKGPLSNGILKPVLDDIYTNWSADAWLVNGHLALKYQGTVGKVELGAKASYTYSHIASYRSTTEFQDFSENLGTINLKVDATLPLGVSVDGHPLALIGHLGNSTFVGPNRDALGFDYLNEVGLSLEVDIAQHDLPVKKLSLGGEYLWGDDTWGWSILFGYRF